MGARLGCSAKYVTKVPTQRLYWMVMSVAAAPSKLAMGSVCKPQNLGERKRMSSIVRPRTKYQTLRNTGTVRPDSRTVRPSNCSCTFIGELYLVRSREIFGW